MKVFTLVTNIKLDPREGKVLQDYLQTVEHSTEPLGILLTPRIQAFVESLIAHATKSL